MIRSSDWKKYKIIVVKFVILLAGMSTAVKLPLKQAQKDILYNEVDNAEIFKDSKVLKEGTEVNAYLLAKETIKILFMVDEENNDVPLSLRVTPCASAVEFKIMRKTIPGYDDYEDSPLFGVQEVKPTHEKTTNPQGIELYSFEGSEAHTFKRHANTSGIYTVFIKPIESDTYVKLFLKSKPVVSVQDKDYPRLPRNSSLIVGRIRRKSFTVSWLPSQDETPYGNIISYCISVSPKRSYDNYCTLMSHKFGDQVPKNTGFFFPWENDIVALFRSKAKPVKPAKPRDIFYTCVGRDTTYIYTQARPGKRYYVNVYAINKKHWLSSAYKRTVITTKRRKRRGNKKQSRHNRPQKLRDGKIMEVDFTKDKHEFIFKYDLNMTSDLHIAVHSCTGRVTLKVARGSVKGQQIMEKKIKRTSHYTLGGNLKPDSYYISVSSRKKDVPKTARLVVSTEQDNLGYPIMPRKTKVFLKDNSTTHNSLTIGWRSTRSRQKYCIYQKEILISAKRKRRRDQCIKHSEPPVSESKKVTCFFHERRERKVHYNIKNLKSSTQYQFDVVIQLKRGYLLSYKSLVAQTKDGS